MAWAKIATNGRLKSKGTRLTINAWPERMRHTEA
jgi:hypothetical protein